MTSGSGSGRSGRPGTPKTRGTRFSGRGLHNRVKTAKGRKTSSKMWLQRQLNDPYVAEAKARGFRSRAAFKLLELDDMFGLLKKGRRVIDLGAAPGGWTQVAVERAKSREGDVHVAAIDYLDMDPVPGAVFLKRDFLDADAPDALLAALGGAPDIVLSDMAAPTTGHRRTDHIRTMHLCEVAADFAVQVLKPGGHFLAKTFQGGAEAALLDGLKRSFGSVHHVKPPASRDESVELYLLAKNFKG